LSTLTGQATKQPSQQELDNGITYAQARANEEYFFDNAEPWTALNPVHQKRLGTKTLTAYLSDQLWRIISRQYVPLADSLPSQPSSKTT